MGRRMAAIRRCVCTGYVICCLIGLGFMVPFSLRPGVDGLQVEELWSLDPEQFKNLA